MRKAVLSGRAFKFGDNVNTDIISPAQYMEMDRMQIAAHAMEGADPEFSRKVRPGDIVVAGCNFGSGSSRETAPMALKDCGVSVVIARFFARIFYRNCINIGLPVLICDQADKIGAEDELEVELSTGTIRDLTTGAEFRCAPLPGHILKLIEAGSLMNFLKDRRAGLDDAP